MSSSPPHTPVARAPTAYRWVAAALWVSAAASAGWLVQVQAGPLPSGWTMAVLAVLLVASTVGTTWHADMSEGAYLTVVEAFSIPMLVLAGPVPALVTVVAASVIRAVAFWDLPHPRRTHLIVTMQASHVLELTLAYLVINLLPSGVNLEFAVIAGAATSIAASFVFVIAWTDTLLEIRTSRRQAARDIGEQILLVPALAALTIIVQARSALAMLLMASVLFALDFSVRENRRRLQAEAHVDVDGLTGLPNHRRFWTALEEACQRLASAGGEVSVVLVDIDDFKQVNDVHGHLTGDEVLRRIAAATDESTRGIDHVFRYGGEEFAILLPQAPAEVARQVAERVRAALPRCHPLGPSGSFGVATSGARWKTPRDLVEQADQALYRAKRAGKNRVEQASDQTVASAG